MIKKKEYTVSIADYNDYSNYVYEDVNTSAPSEFTDCGKSERELLEEVLETELYINLGEDEDGTR